MAQDILQMINESSEFLKSKIKNTPEIGIILGTGLGALADEIKKEIEIDYSDIPNFPISTVESHQGKLIFGKIGNQRVMAMQGRFHLYEGYTMQQITFPVRVMKKLGINKLFISNACGSLNPYIRKESIMIIDDHVNLIGDNPLIGKHYDEWGPRFVDMSEPYSNRLIEIAEKVAIDNNLKVYKGVYAAMSGPSLETRAEYRFLRTIGADVIGMSTIPECIVARQMGLEVFGVSIVTDECYPDALKPLDVKEIINAANNTEPRLTLLMKKMLENL